MEKVTGYTAAEIGSMHPLDFFEGKEKQFLAESIEAVFCTGIGEAEATFVSKDGTHTPYYFTGVRAEIDGKRCLLGMGIDISLRKRSEEALRATDQRLRTAAKAANVGLWDWDLITNEVYFSPEWKSQIGYQENEIGHSFDEWQSRVHPDDLESALFRMREFVRNPCLKYSAEFRLRHRDGSYRWILSQASLLFNEQGIPIRMLGSHVDMTERRKAEKQHQQAVKMEAIGQSTAGIAHDFNNLLTVINGCSEMLLEMVPFDDPKHELVEDIRQASERSTALTRQLLAFSRQQSLSPKVLNLNKVVTSSEKMLRRLVGEDIQLKTVLHPQLDSVKADPGQLEQVVVNLAVNARDAMSPGGKLTIETANIELDEAYARTHTGVAAGRYVMLSVTDTGSGITEEVQSRLFEPFFSTKVPGKGTGLGLAVVYGIVKQSDGHIEVVSELGVGTSFKIFLMRAE